MGRDDERMEIEYGDRVPERPNGRLRYSGAVCMCVDVYDLFELAMDAVELLWTVELLAVVGAVRVWVG